MDLTSIDDKNLVMTNGNAKTTRLVQRGELLKSFFPFIGTSLLLLGTLSGCDLEGRKECAWVLEPEPKLIGSTEGDYIPVCARNRTSNKEDCRLQATIDYAKSVYGRKFRYVDLRIKSVGLPRTISSIKFCDNKGD